MQLQGAVCGRTFPLAAVPHAIIVRQAQVLLELLAPLQQQREVEMHMDTNTCTYTYMNATMYQLLWDVCAAACFSASTHIHCIRAVMRCVSEDCSPLPAPPAAAFSAWPQSACTSSTSSPAAGAIYNQHLQAWQLRAMLLPYSSPLLPLKVCSAFLCAWSHADKQASRKQLLLAHALAVLALARTMVLLLTCRLPCAAALCACGSRSQSPCSIMRCSPQLCLQDLVGVQGAYKGHNKERSNDQTVNNHWSWD
jgi:hypothetical protein